MFDERFPYVGSASPDNNEPAERVTRLPPIVRSLPEMPAFLTSIQKQAFALGVVAAFEMVLQTMPNVERSEAVDPTTPTEAKTK